MQARLGLPHELCQFARQGMLGMLPISLQFSLTHPLFQSRFKSAAVVSPTSEQCDFELRRVTQSISLALISVVRVRLGSASVHMALEPCFLAALWCEGL